MPKSSMSGPASLSSTINTSKLALDVSLALKESNRLLARSEQSLQQAQEQRGTDLMSLEIIRYALEEAENFLAVAKHMLNDDSRQCGEK